MPGIVPGGASPEFAGPNGRPYDYEESIGVGADARMSRFRPFAGGDFIAGVDENLEECRAKSYLDVDVLARTSRSASHRNRSRTRRPPASPAPRDAGVVGDPPELVRGGNFPDPGTDSIAVRPVAVVAGVGGHVPSGVVTDSELSSLYGESDPSLRGGTGVGGRRWVGPGEATSDLATAAGRAALESLGADGAVDVVILATATPDHPAPATAPLVARRLGLREVPAFDLAAMGSGFVYGLAVADGMIAAGTARRILLIGADAFSTILNPNDRSTAAEFADGAGAVVLRAGERDEPGALHGIDLGSDGYLADLITLSAGGTRQPDRDAARPADRWLAVRGQALHRHTALRMTAAARTALARAGWRPGDVDRFVAQQTNASTLVAVAAELGIPEDRMYRDSGRTGDTVAACIPLALTAAAADGELRAGDRVLVAAFGGGATWGAAALTWPDL